MELSSFHSPLTIHHLPVISKFSDKSENLDAGMSLNAGFAPDSEYVQDGDTSRQTLEH